MAVLISRLLFFCSNLFNKKRKVTNVNRTFSRLWSKVENRNSKAEFYELPQNLCTYDDEEEEDEYNSLLTQDLINETIHFGSLRFRVSFKDVSHLCLILYEASNLHQRNLDDKTNIYVNVSICPGKYSFDTNIQRFTSNPTFNKTFYLTIPNNDIEDKDLLLKVMKSCYHIQDELIGVIRLPLMKIYDKEFKSTEYTCTINEESHRDEGIIFHQEADKLHLQISSQNKEIELLKTSLRHYEKELTTFLNELLQVQIEKVNNETIDHQTLRNTSDLIQNNKQFDILQQKQDLGQIYIGLFYFGKKLRIDIVFAVKEKCDFDVKLQVTHESEFWEFEANCNWNDSSSTYDEQFIINNEFSKKDLSNLILEMNIKDEKCQTVGKILLANRDEDWIEILEVTNGVVKMFHDTVKVIKNVTADGQELILHSYKVLRSI